MEEFLKLDRLDKLDSPIAVWMEKERFRGIKDCLTIILRTKGCHWNKCLMCGYSQDADKRVAEENLQNQFDYALNKFEEDFDVVKIFTSGSFFDEREIPQDIREYIYQKVVDNGVEKLSVESRPEFITANKLIGNGVVPEVGVGLETSNEFVRENCVNKGFTFEDFRIAASLLKEENALVKVYLLLKPPFLSEREAIEDTVRSALDVKEYADVVSVNPTNIPSRTYIEVLWKKRMYRPPWLWSMVEVVKRVREEGIEVIGDPVAGGKERGPHNCGKCDGQVSRAIRNFSLSQTIDEIEELDELNCGCIHLWRKALELEDYSRIPLFR
ncbi:MAG: archaeosine biosynthesis radical SAM protein RaSEA [Archaeoglobaceae archaeon]